MMFSSSPLVSLEELTSDILSDSSSWLGGVDGGVTKESPVEENKRHIFYV